MKFEVIIIGGGRAGSKVALALQEAGIRTAVISSGRSIHEVNCSEFTRRGGIAFNGDTVTSAIVEESRMTKIMTCNLGSFPLEADWFVMSTGKFLSRGLRAGMVDIEEPVLGLDLSYDEDRDTWFDPDFTKKQNFLDIGVKTDRHFHPSIKGKTVSNLFVCGELLAGVNSIDSEDEIERSAEKVATMLIKQIKHLTDAR